MSVSSEEGSKLHLNGEESATVDFKATFDPSVSSAWPDLVKDIVAFANSGGGVILFGVNDDGSASGADLAAVTALDPAEITNKIYKYTDHQFSGFRFSRVDRNGSVVAMLEIDSTDVPLVFTKPGTYAVPPNHQKTVFSQGTVYFRHGAKSEPATTDDLRAVIDRRLESIRRSWLDGIAKVVEAPPGATIAVLPPGAALSLSSKEAAPIRLVSDASATPYYAVPVDQTHPYRQKDLVAEINKRLAGKAKITPHQILCIRRVHQVDNKVELCYRQRFASHRYSDAFLDWVMARFAEDVNFFSKTKKQHDDLQSARSGRA